MSEDLHTHARTDEIAVFWIPADPVVPKEMKVVNNDFRALQMLVGGTMEQLPYNGPELHCGCRVGMFGNEDGRMLNLTPNVRLMAVSDVMIRGDVFLVGEGLVTPKGMAIGSEDGELDMFSLPQSFSTWKGPGHAYPAPQQPWEPGYGT